MLPEEGQSSALDLKSAQLKAPVALSFMIAGVMAKYVGNCSDSVSEGGVTQHRHDRPGQADMLPTIWKLKTSHEEP
jgi:hypothetical protein